jgi:hypothetical protein
MIYETDTDLTFIWGGSAWQQVSGGTAVGNSGLVYITSGALSTAVTDFVGCFTSTYTNYLIVGNSLQTNSTADIYFQMLSGTTPATSADYFFAFLGLRSSNNVSNNAGGSQTVGFTGFTNNGANNLPIGSFNLNVNAPQLSQRTVLKSSCSSYPTEVTTKDGTNLHNLTNSYDGIRFLTQTASTMGGTITVYGYRK